jgi:hypothetical protein
VNKKQNAPSTRRRMVRVIIRLLSGCGCTRIYQIVASLSRLVADINPRQSTPCKGSPEPVQVGASNDKIGRDCGKLR